MRPGPTPPSLVRTGALRAACAALVALLGAYRPAGATLILGEADCVPAGYTPKDFTILQTRGEFHAFFIMNNLALRAAGTYEAQHRNERRFGHAVSRDLRTWTFADSNFSADPAGWDRDHVWSPCLVEADSVYWMFYTGVADTMGPRGWTPGPQKIGVAWSTDLSTWHRTAQPILECGTPSLPWADCGGDGARDPFVMRADETVPGSSEPRGWLLYYTTKPASSPDGSYNPYGYVVGVAQAPAGGLTAWSDLGPLWSTYRNYQGTPGSNKVESAHLAREENGWFLFFTGDDGVYRRWGLNPVGDVPLPQSAWVNAGEVEELGPNEYASETFRAVWGDGTTETYFASLQSFVQFHHAIQLRLLMPGKGSLLVDPLTFESLATSKGNVLEGDSLALLARSTVPTTSAALSRELTRAAPVQVFEVDTANGQETRDEIPPADAGVPGTLRVTTEFLAGDDSESIPFRARFVPDDDDTPDRDEFVVVSRGVSSNVFTVARAGTTVDVPAPAPRPASPAVRLRALGDTPIGGGEGLLVELAEPDFATLEILDAGGRRVREVARRDFPAGASLERWDRLDSSGARAPGGIYFARLRTARGAASAKVLVLR